MAEAPVHVVVHDGDRQHSGVAHAGESWSVAARRTVASMHLDPYPQDLSGEVKHFTIDHDRRVALRAMPRGDLPDVARGLATEHVRRWFGSQGERNVIDLKARQHAFAAPRCGGRANATSVGRAARGASAGQSSGLLGGGCSPG